MVSADHYTPGLGQIFTADHPTRVKNACQHPKHRVNKQIKLIHVELIRPLQTKSFQNDITKQCAALFQVDPCGINEDCIFCLTQRRDLTLGILLVTLDHITKNRIEVRVLPTLLQLQKTACRPVFRIGSKENLRDETETAGLMLVLL